MDDTGLQSKVKGNKLTDDDQKQIDDALNKLPDMPGASSIPKVDEKTDDAKPTEPVSPIPSSTPASPLTTSTPGDLKTPSPTPVTPATSPVTDQTTTGGLPPLPPIPPVTPPASNPNIAEEKPEISKPPSKLKQGLKKNGKKIAGGMLVLALLAGGMMVGRNVVQERQTAESEATVFDPDDTTVCSSLTQSWNCSGCSNKAGKACKWKDGECKYITKNKCKGEGQLDDDEIGCINWDTVENNMCNVYYCPKKFTFSDGGCNTGKGDLTKQQARNGNFCGLVKIDCYYYNEANEMKNLPICNGGVAFLEKISRKTCETDEPETHSVCNETTFACEQVAGAGTNECATNEDCEEETHLECNETTFACEVVAGAGTDTCATNDDCAVTPLSCASLSGDVVGIELDDTVTFTCEGSFSSIAAPVAYFRHSIDGGTPVVDPLAYPIDLVTNTASADILVDEYGDWSVECRVCEDNTAASCTAWGQAN